MAGVLGHCYELHIHLSKFISEAHAVDAIVQPMLAYTCELWAPVCSDKPLDHLVQVHICRLAR